AGLALAMRLARAHHLDADRPLAHDRNDAEDATGRRARTRRHLHVGRIRTSRRVLLSLANLSHAFAARLARRNLARAGLIAGAVARRGYANVATSFEPRRLRRSVVGRLAFARSPRRFVRGTAECERIHFARTRNVVP